MDVQSSVLLKRFTKKVTVAGYKLSFCFNGINTHDSVLYYVSVVDRHGKTWLFYMRYKEGEWRVSNPVNCPEWIIALEQELSILISAHIQT